MVYLISLILLLLPTYLLRFSVFGVPTTVLEVLIYLVFIFGLYQTTKTGLRKMPLKIILPIVLLIIALTISAAIVPDKRAALGELKGFFIDPVLVFWLIYQFVKYDDAPKLFAGLIGSGAFVAAHAIIQRLLGNITADGRVIGIFGYSPNYLSLFLAPITVLLVAYIIQSKFKKFALVIGAWSLVIIYILALYFSGSRGGLLALAVGISVFLIIYYWSWIRRHLSSRIIIGILALMAVYTSWTFFRPDFNAPLSSGRVVTSNNLRWQIWQTSWELGRQHPILGVGLGNFQNAFNELTKNRGNFPEYITPMALTPHNIFLMFWLSTGLLGLVSFLWLLGLFFRRAFEKKKTPEAVILLAIMVSIVAYGLVESSIWKNDLGIIFWTIWGMIWVI